MDRSPGAGLQSEGRPYTHVVVLRFRDEEAARRWYDSPEYREIVGCRHRAAEGVALLVHGR